MNFAAVDPELHEWAMQRNLPLSTNYQDSEVRSFQLASASGKRVQIWLEVGREVKVFVWDYRRRKMSFVAQPGELSSKLDEAYRVAKEWMGD